MCPLKLGEAALGRDVGIPGLCMALPEPLLGLQLIPSYLPLEHLDSFPRAAHTQRVVDVRSTQACLEFLWGIG